MSAGLPPRGTAAAAARDRLGALKLAMQGEVAYTVDRDVVLLGVMVSVHRRGTGTVVADGWARRDTNLAARRALARLHRREAALLRVAEEELALALKGPGGPS